MGKILLIVFLVPFFISLAGAETIEIPSPTKAKTFQDFIDALIDFIFKIALALAPLLIIVGGFYMVTSAGDIKRIEMGKKIILYTIVGLLIILLAKATINFLIEQMKGQPSE